MKKLTPAFILILITGLALWFGTTRLPAQSEGDQILDGIGETALIARYVFDGNTQDRSRNQFHAEVIGDDPSYTEHSPFDKVLALQNSALRIPGQALAGVDSLSISCWVHLIAEKPGQRLFDFEGSPGRGFYCELTGPDIDNGLRVRITGGGEDAGQGFSARFRSPGRWFHVTVVFDAVHRTLTGYVMGREAGQADNITLSLEDVLDWDNPENNRLLIAQAASADKPAMEAHLRDLRLYSIPLSQDQARAVAFGEGGGRRRERAVDPEAPELRSLALIKGLTNVPDIAVNTTVDVLPRLPAHIPGVYEQGAAGPQVRVLWPAPADNSAVLEPGTYTLTGVVPGTPFEPKAVVTVKPAEPAATPEKPKMKAEPFPLGRVVLKPFADGRKTPFIKNRDKFVSGLSTVNPDTFLYNFRDAFGQPQPEGTEQLGGWDSHTSRLRGHASGHYLSALAQAYAGSIYDESLQAGFLKKMNYMIDTLYALAQKSGRPAEPGGPHNADPLAIPPGPGKTGYDSDLSKDGIRRDYWNWGEGFISAYPPDQFIMLEKGATYGSTNDQIWAPYYTLHKILAGLLDCYEVGGNPKALEIAEGMGTWSHKRLQAVSADTRIAMWNRYIAGEYGGMNEVMARISRLTGNPDFLACARLFDNTKFFFGDAEHSHGLAKNVDTIRSRHANQHIPQIIGAMETYRMSGIPDYHTVADNFWTKVWHHYMYNIGGVAGAKNPQNSECFTTEPDTLFTNGFNMGGQNETCATYNMLKLSRHLFFFDPDPRYMDYYEQGLYNHILASVAEDNAGNTYHVPLNPGARKRFSNEDMDGFTCCNGTALESNTKLQDSIYFKSTGNQALYVNLYVPSTVNWEERGVSVTQNTNFPYADSVTLKVSGVSPFALKLRVPAWATQGFFVKINGQEENVQAEPGSYLTLKRDWKDGDTITLRMPFSFRLEPVMDMPNLASIFYGPVLLAVQEEGPLPAWRAVTLDAEDMARSIDGDPSALHFTIDGLELKPFFETYGHHSVYVDVTLE